MLFYTQFPFKLEIYEIHIKYTETRMNLECNHHRGEKVSIPAFWIILWIYDDGDPLHFNVCRRNSLEPADGPGIQKVKMRIQKVLNSFILPN